ncbi:S-type pyocin domain-containing protein [Erwinia sp. SLM-02]|uniref:S-type pyocin domain-containing protein n=1 Tax=Erwinia sp. SLM-02 TaxID=3020057 RepID=UPI00308054D1
MATPAYYQNGIPHAADGSVIITITGGPTKPIENTGTNSYNPFPVQVPWDAIHGGGSVVYDPKKPGLYGLYGLRNSQDQINQFLDKANKDYPNNSLQVKNEAVTLLNSLRTTGLINKPEVNTLAKQLQDAVNALQENIDLKNKSTQVVKTKEQETVSAFQDFMNNHQMSNFLNKPADMIDIAISLTGKWLVDLWNKAVPPKYYAEIQEKNNLVTYLDRIKIITADVKARSANLAEIKTRIEAEIRKVEEARKALFSQAGVIDAPVYTGEMVKAANVALAAAGATVLGRAGGMTQLSTMGNGVMTTGSELAGWVSSALWRGAVSLSEIATTSALGPIIGAFVIGFWPKKVGEGSDNFPGRDVAMLAVQASLIAAGKTSIRPEMTSVNLPVRGFISTGKNGQQEVTLVKTGTGGVSASVPVYRPVRDAKTGLDKIVVPKMAGVPSRTILINPIPTGPIVPPHTGNDSPVPRTPVHTGTEIKQADSIVAIPLPANNIPSLQDFIFWQPDAAGSGVEPVYVMLGVYGETNAVGKYSGREYNTNKIGFPIEYLNWRGAIINRAGVDLVKLHTGRFGNSFSNIAMIERLEKILNGKLNATDTDKRFYTHEIRELERYRALSVPDGELPENEDEVWNNAHTATLEDYQLSSDINLLYTPEALNGPE